MSDEMSALEFILILITIANVIVFLSYVFAIFYQLIFL